MFIEIAEGCVRDIVHDLYAAADRIEEMANDSNMSMYGLNALRFYSGLRGSAEWLEEQLIRQVNKDGQQEFENSR